MMTGPISNLLPHSGEMVFIDRIVDWGDEFLKGAVRGDFLERNPLLVNGRMPALCCIEICAQAMALHGALISDEAARGGLLASLRNIKIHSRFLASEEAACTAEVHLIMKTAKSCAYEFCFMSDQDRVVEGQAGVFFQ